MLQTLPHAPVFTLAGVVLFGLAIGSFLNVVIARVPARRSLWRPGSACPACGTAIAWHDNIPLLSFLVLRGRCRACGVPISWRYPLVEVVTAAALASAYLAFGPTPEFLVASTLLAALIAITAIDLEQQLIPDAITVPGILAGLGLNIATGRVSWLDSVVGIGLAAGLFLAVILLSGGGMGGGDLKLGAMLGAFLGWKVVLVALFVGIILGGALAIVLLASGRAGRKDPIPFGPFLAAGAAVALFWGDRIVSWYTGGFGL